ncbi:MAG TPA: metal-dependent transcriptional regulator [Abditibacteriaceae bacterium]|jgi:DtxR family Mn-dependent transcriptional regulator|nr:metal-dependent transcriptional regulator [Abditibacteriaceae bacterium]
MTKNPRKTLSSSGEDYLKAIYKLRDAEASISPANVSPANVSTQALAARLGVSPPSATAMVKKLATMKLVVHSPYRGVELTPAGEQIALEVIRHHRLVETYLSEVLGVAWDKVHDEAERWEHVLSEEVEAKMAEALGHPTRDPHGAPIPDIDGKIAHDNWTRLGEAVEGTTWTMCRASDEHGETLRHLSELGLVPGARIEVLRAAPEEGVLHLRVAGRQQILGLGPAQSVFVKSEG